MAQNFNELLSAARTRKKLRLDGVAHQVGISKGHLHSIESGGIKSPQFALVVKLSRALGVSLKKLAETIPHEEVEVLSK